MSYSVVFFHGNVSVDGKSDDTVPGGITFDTARSLVTLSVSTSQLERMVGHPLGALSAMSVTSSPRLAEANALVVDPTVDTATAPAGMTIAPDANNCF